MMLTDPDSTDMENMHFWLLKFLVAYCIAMKNWTFIPVLLDWDLQIFVPSCLCMLLDSTPGCNISQQYASFQVFD